VSLILDNRERLVGKIYKGEEYLGSCIPCTIKGVPYVITCGHVIYGDNFDKVVNESDTFDIKTTSSIFRSLSIITTFEKSKASDVIVLKLDSSADDFDIESLIELKLCTSVDELIIPFKPHLVLVPELEGIVSAILIKTFLDSPDDCTYRVEVKKDTFHNIGKGTCDAKEYKGVSGSGIFISYQDNIYLSGVLSQIPKSSVSRPLVFQRPELLQHSFAFESYYTIGTTVTIENPLVPLPHSDLVFFTNYTMKSKDFYNERECDREFNECIARSENIWLYGESGVGKTALINRNLLIGNYNSIICDFEAVTILVIEDIWQTLVDAISQSLGIASFAGTLNVKAISDYLTNANLENSTIIVIDEMSCDDSSVITRFCNDTLGLVRTYSKNNENKKIAFIISSIFSPKKYPINIPKLIQSFELLCANEWGRSLEDLFDIQNNALNIGICSDGKKLIIELCDNSPRVLTRVVMKVHRNGAFDMDSILKISQKTILEYNE
jgi:hypothetical protein